MANGNFTQFPIPWESIEASDIPYDDTTVAAALAALQQRIPTYTDDGSGNITITIG